MLSKQPLRRSEMPYSPLLVKPFPDDEYLAQPEGTAQEATGQKSEEAVSKEVEPNAKITQPGKASEIQGHG
jgi:hypothetical protein